MQHGIAVDAVILGITALHGIDDAAEIALLVQDVIELQADGERFASEESMTDLGVPYQFVGIH